MGCNCGNKNKTVVSTVPTTTITEMCSCGKPKSECGKGTCGCKHEQKPCLEDHSVTLVESVYTTTVTATDTWVMPAVDDCVQLHLKDVTNILPGSILWNKSVGYLHVSSYDASSGYVTACNEGEDGNAEVGSTFPSCMSFHVGIPTQCTCDDGYTGACLAADVTSPGVGETTEVSVTTVSGLFIGDIIDIAGYMYKITAITDINTITVKNEGFGAPIGTVIKNDPNCTGKPCTVKITVVNSDDPCAKDPVNEGVIIVCDEGERKPFEGTADDQIAVWDNEDKKWKLETIKINEECTNTTVDVTLDPLISVYIVTVEKTSIFSVGDVVYLADRKFTVDSIINSTQMRIAIDEAPSAITVVEEGAALCLGDCCENLPSKFSDVVTVPNSVNYVDIQYPWKKLHHNGSTPDNAGQSYSKTITISAPSGTANRPLTLLGTITLSHNSAGFADTHYYTLVQNGSPNNQQTNTTNNILDRASWTGMCYIVPPRVCLSGNITVSNGGTTTKLFPEQYLQFNSVGIRRYAHGSQPADPTESASGNRGYGQQTIDGMFTYEAFYCTPNNDDGIGVTSNDTKTSAIPINQSLTLPVSITVNGTSSVTLTIDYNIMLLNARGKLPDERQAWTDEVVAMQIRQTNVIASLAWIVQ